ncbi:ribosomal RNA small subunit methyltransferase G [Alphaproteobacteria bacterium]|nr:ribosomal RNA small subunit methyltransferase G [Alphaproteobacteria bacterium]
MTTIEQKKHNCFIQIKKFCNLSSMQEKKLEDYVNLLLSHNQSFNLIGNSTTENIWERHILDCAQLIKFIDNFDLKFADIGSGAGLPGIVLSILGLKEIHLIEKSFRKCEFLRKAKLFSNNRLLINNSKLEELNNQKYDYLVSRALAPLPKLLEYSIKFLNNDGFCLFLKGKNLQFEIEESQKIFEFDFDLFKSITSQEGNIIRLKKIIKK